MVQLNQGLVKQKIGKINILNFKEPCPTTRMLKDKKKYWKKSLIIKSKIINKYNFLLKRLKKIWELIKIIKINLKKLIDKIQ